MKNSTKAYLLSRIGALGIGSLLLVYALVYIPGTWEVIVLGLSFLMIPMMLFVSMGLIDESLFQTLEAISNMSTKDIREALRKKQEPVG